MYLLNQIVFIIEEKIWLNWFYIDIDYTLFLGEKFNEIDKLKITQDILYTLFACHEFN